MDLMSCHRDPMPDGRLGMKHPLLLFIFTPLLEIRTILSLLQIRKLRLGKVK